MKRFSFAILVFLLALAPFLAQAQTPAPPANQGVYVMGGGGATWQDDMTLDSPGVFNTPFRTNSGHEDGTLWTGEVGYFYHNWTAGFEVAGRDNDGNGSGSLFANGFGPIAPGPVASNLDSTAYMFNVGYDFNQARAAGFFPYVKAGVGYVEVDYSYTQPNLSSLAIVSGDDGGLAYQFEAGVGWNFWRSMNVRVAYNYFNGGEVDINAGAAFGGLPIPAFSGDYVNQAVKATLEYRF